MVKSSGSITAGKDSKTGSARDALWPNYSPPQDLVITHGLGSELFTAAGDAYLDFLSGIAVTSFGHAHPHLVAALNEQSGKVWHLSNVFRIPAAERLAGRLSEHSFADRVFFANSGTEAVEAGIKAIRGYQLASGNADRHRIIGFSDSFHGRTLAALAAAGNESHMRGFIPMDYGFDQVEWENLPQLKQAIGANTAGIILEPVQGEGGIRPISAEFMQQVKGLCEEHGLVLMMDEVQCGVGRSGKLFAHQHYGITPDVMALAKGLGGGFPVGACLTTEAIGETMVVGTHGSTFGGNPLAMAVGNAVMDLLLEPGQLDEVTAKSDYLMDHLQKLVAQFPKLIVSIHGLGLMIGIKCVVPCGDMLNKLRSKKLLVGKSGANMIRLLPPLNISYEHLDQALQIIEEALLEFQDA
ncbi:MAG: acetylornithine transaminase [Gammaproteobacteria bacterium]|nr:acetylornithine transaminase [Gammaproteobacteria bacterium]